MDFSRTCPYCGKNTVDVVAYEETVTFQDKEVVLKGERLQCSNPECPEPIRYTEEQAKQLDDMLKKATTV